jgi:photosystem II stability/assembly factor-like uncharacterized protein
MKKSIFHLLIPMLLIGMNINAQNWAETNIPSDGARYDDVFFLNENIGWAANGWGYKTYKTTDGGETWDFIFETPDQYQRNIEFLNEDIGILGTLSENLYRTTDGGETWDLIAVPGIEAICGLDAVDETTIYGCGAFFQPAYVIKSTDSGENWEFIDMSPYADALVEVLFEDELTGYAAGSSPTGGVVLKTTDGGVSWTELYNTNIPGEMVWKLQILYSNPNVIFGAVQSFSPLNGKLIKSVDKGQNWVSREVPDTYIQGVGFVTEDHGWMGGHYSGFLETFDAGQTWVDTGFGYSLNRFQFFNGNLAYCSGVSIYKYTDNLKVNDISTKDREDLAIQVFPNPVVGNTVNVRIDFKRNDHLVVMLFDESGRKIGQLLRETITEAGQRQYQFNVPEKPGIYYLNFHYDLGYQSAKIIKK